LPPECSTYFLDSASTAYNANVMAINSTDGKIVWQSQVLGDPKTGYNIPRRILRNWNLNGIILKLRPGSGI